MTPYELASAIAAEGWTVAEIEKQIIALVNAHHVPQQTEARARAKELYCVLFGKHIYAPKPWEHDEEISVDMIAAALEAERALVWEQAATKAKECGEERRKQLEGLTEPNKTWVYCKMTEAYCIYDYCRDQAARRT